MLYNKFIYVGLLTVFIFSSCTDEKMNPDNLTINIDNGGGGLVHRL